MGLSVKNIFLLILMSLFIGAWRIRKVLERIKITGDARIESSSRVIQRSSGNFSWISKLNFEEFH